MVLMNIMKKGAVPVPYIIALVLGIIVLAILSYWLFFSSGQAGMTIKEYSCRAKKMSYCNEWRMNAWESPPDGLVFCDYAPDCCQFDWAKDLVEDDCK